MKVRNLGWMVSWRLLPVLLASSLFLIGPCARAQQLPAGASQDEIGTVYLSNGQVLAALEPRLLTKNAQIASYFCAPTGTRIGYLSSRVENGQIVRLIGVVTTQSGDDTVYYRADDPTKPQPGAVLIGLVSIFGWCDDAAYFSFTDFKYMGGDTGQLPLEGELKCIDLVHGDIQTAPIPLDQMAPADADGQKIPLQNEVIRSAVWAPQARLLAFAARTQYANYTLRRWGLFLYDPDRQTTRLAALYVFPTIQSPEPVLEGWQDRNHLIYHTGAGRFVYDLGSGQSAPAPPAERVVRAPSTANAPVTWFPTGNVKVFVNEANGTLPDQAVSASKAATLSIKRTGGPLKPQTLQLDAFFPTPLANDAQFLPNNGFDPAGAYHVVYLSDGDLKEVDLVERAATPVEKLAAGDKLSCDEETPIAESYARQLGLAIMQSLIDNNETFPPGGGFHDRIAPYMQGDTVFTSPNGAPFRYLAPSSLKLGDIEAPADTPLGEFDLPCKKIVLYADGHVKAEDNGQPSSPGGSQ